MLIICNTILTEIIANSLTSALPEGRNLQTDLKLIISFPPYGPGSEFYCLIPTEDNSKLSRLKPSACKEDIIANRDDVSFSHENSS